jgi:hypothetical protein
MRIALAVALVLVQASAGSAQTVTTEVDLNGGLSSQDVAAAATQVRVFGEAGPRIQFFVEGSLAGEHGPQTDAFSAAYPYATGAHLMEAYGERVFQPGRLIAGVRAGRFRTPFGIYARSDHAYAGFLRAPLIRYDGYFALSNNFLEHGVSGFFGTPHLAVESSLGAPADVGSVERRSGLDFTARVQGYAGPLIVGVSHIRTQPYLPVSFASGEAIFTGVDARWMVGGVQLRTEWLFGRPFDGTSTSGGYVDVIVHRPVMGPVTAVFRAERINYETDPRFALYAWRETAGTRIRLVGGLTAQADVIHQTSQIAYGRSVVVDVGLTYSIRR